MMMGAMDVPVAMACVVEQADVAVDVVAAEQEPAERRSLPSRLQMAPAPACNEEA